MTHALVIENLTKRYKDFTLDKISFTLPQGTILGFIGENGSGKSTLINTMLGIIPSDYSRLDILGRDLKTKPNEIKSDLAVIFDDAGYDEYFTPLQIGRFLSYVYPNWNMNMFRSYLHRFGLPAKKRLKTFSRGMRTKLEFAIAFSHDPKFLIMDEATNGLDPIFRDEILELLREFSEEENHTVLIASHITSDLDKIADYVAFLHQGKLLFFQPYDKLQNEYGILTCKNSFLCNLNPADVVFYRKEEYNCRVLVKNRFALAKIFQDMEILPATLEDLMLFYTKGEKLK